MRLGETNVERIGSLVLMLALLAEPIAAELQAMDVESVDRATELLGGACRTDPSGLTTLTRADVSTSSEALVNV